MQIISFLKSCIALAAFMKCQNPVSLVIEGFRFNSVFAKFLTRVAGGLSS